jgi:hypothetical protein
MPGLAAVKHVEHFQPERRGQGRKLRRGGSRFFFSQQF